jgi:predicted secreted protein
MVIRMPGVPAHIDLDVGQACAIELPGLGTAGYVWDHATEGAPDVIDVDWTRGYPAGSARRPPGASAPEVATIRALRAGEVELRLYRHRRWEPPDEVESEHRISVAVHAR